MTLYTPSVEFYVPGEPAPQGSKKAFRVKNSEKINVVESSRRVKPWRLEVVAATPPEYRYEGPVEVSVDFRFTQAKSNKDIYPTAKNKGDLDKLLRSIYDALTMSGMIEDDSLVIDSCIRKRWATNIYKAGAHISVSNAQRMD